MEYQKIINLLGNMPNQPSKFRTKNWVEVNDDACETYNTNNQIKFKTSMLKSSLYDYSDTSVENPNNNDKKVVFKNCAPFTDCISEINNNAVTPMHNSIEYIDNYSKT